jgi:hypothetical protein
MKEIYKTQLESFANELLLDLFEYFDGVHLLRAFYDLNSRFDTLLLTHFRQYHLDLRSIFKQDFDFLCQHHLHSTADRIVSLNVTERDETPGSLKLLVFRGFTVDQFIYLRSLSLSTSAWEDIAKFPGEIHRLVHLRHLNIRYCDNWFEESGNPNQYLLNQIWNLPKLTNFNLKTYYACCIDFTKLKVISPTLKYLSLQTSIRFSFPDVAKLFQHTPNLRFLDMRIAAQDEDEEFPIICTSIITLKLKICGEKRDLHNLVQKMPNICNLTVEMENDYLNGHEWKQIIIDHLPKLKVLRFNMHIYHLRGPNTGEEVDELLDTFRTSFWIDEHQWYVRCDWDLAHTPSSGCLYTLPYTFRTFTEIDCGGSKWTCPDDKKSGSYDCVYKFSCAKSQFKDYKSLDLYPACFPNIHDLRISFPLPDKIWCIISALDHLTSLSVSISEEQSESDLQPLIDRALRLHILTIKTSNPSQLMVLSKLRSASIRQVNFFPEIFNIQQLFVGHAECAAFVISPLGRQCEVLGISVDSQESVVNIVNAMTHLRSLTIDFEYDHNEKSSLEADAVITWLQNYLPARCSISSCTNETDYISMRLWIG